jgi:DNA-binding CsgD family transcriptional regulator
VLGRGQDAEETAQQAEQTSTAIEVRVLAQGARAISEALAGDSHAGNELWRLAENLGAWDPLVTAVRACPPLAELFGTTEAIRPGLRLLYERSNDLGLARKAGFRTRPAGRPSDLLSPRELEVLELLARGFRNRDVAEALVISESTTKVHVRHILEKLGVRTRAEAVARLGLVP